MSLLPQHSLFQTDINQNHSLLSKKRGRTSDSISNMYDYDAYTAQPHRQFTPDHLQDHNKIHFVSQFSPINGLGDRQDTLPISQKRCVVSEYVSEEDEETMNDRSSVWPFRQTQPKRARFQVIREDDKEACFSYHVPAFISQEDDDTDMKNNGSTAAECDNNTNDGIAQSQLESNVDMWWKCKKSDMGMSKSLPKQEHCCFVCQTVYKTGAGSPSSQNTANSLHLTVPVMENCQQIESSRKEKKQSLLSYFQCKPSVGASHKHTRTSSSNTSSSTTGVESSMNQCFHCERYTCPSSSSVLHVPKRTKSDCSRVCYGCRHTFCLFCSDVNYDDPCLDRVFCFECKYRSAGECCGISNDAMMEG